MSHAASHHDAQADHAEDVGPRRSWALLAVALAAQILVVLDISVVNTELRLSRVMISNGQYAAARELLQKVEADAAGTESYTDVLTHLGDAYRTEGDFARAAPLLRKSLADARRANNLPLMLPSLLSLAFIDIAEGRR